MSKEIFPYDQWKTKEGKRMARLRTTKEETETTDDVSRELWKYQQEVKQENSVYDEESAKDTSSKNYNNIKHPVSLDRDVSEADGSMDSSWAKAGGDPLEMILKTELENELLKSLSEKQRNVYMECMLGGLSFAEYAREHNVTRQAIYKLVKKIRAKTRKLLDE